MHLLLIDLFIYLQDLDGDRHFDCIPGDMTQVALIHFAESSLSQSSKRTSEMEQVFQLKINYV